MGKKAVEAWGNGRDSRGKQFKPRDSVGWRLCFQDWVRSRWYDSPFPYTRFGPDAKAPYMVPVVEVINAGGVLYLDAPEIAVVWQEYLNEVEERRRWWNKFESQHGQQEAIFWDNAAGQAYRTQQGA